MLAADLVPICTCTIWRQMYRDTAHIFPDVPKCPHALLDDVHHLAHVSAFPRRAYGRYRLRDIHGGWRFPLGIPHLTAPATAAVYGCVTKVVLSNSSWRIQWCIFRWDLTIHCRVLIDSSYESDFPQPLTPALRSACIGGVAEPHMAPSQTIGRINKV